VPNGQSDADGAAKRNADADPDLDSNGRANRFSGAHGDPAADIDGAGAR
jgi:hypothetical protein